jgi:Fe2+ or Zn2+ uptake regulation protein
MAATKPQGESQAELDQRLVTALRERGQRVTSQRLVIHRALREAGCHVTAEAIHAAVSERLPNVSLPTVYSTLELFESLGMVRRVNAGGGAVLYDPKGEPHHHLVCRNCGRVEDLEQELDLSPALRAAGRTGFTPSDAELVVSGLCAACAPAQAAA